jgi:uncharacterized protein (TIGR02996 family)
MKHKDPFLAQIVANPADADLRLVYADWLDEGGDRRGEFIRVQDAMSVLVPSCDEYVRLKARRAELRQLVDKKWRKAIGDVPRHRPLFHRLPRHRIERWRLVEEFMETWYSPLEPGDGCSQTELAAAERRLGCQLPAALREWYLLAGNRQDVWSKQDHLVALTGLEIEPQHDALMFYYENQGCEAWGIRSRDLRREDPPVHQFFEPARATPSVTGFAILVLLCEVKFAKRTVWAGGQVPQGIVSRELKAMALRKCQITSHYWVTRPVSFYEGSEMIVEYSGSGWIDVTAQSETAYGNISSAIRSQLERKQ